MVAHFTTALEKDILAEKKEQCQKKNTTFVFSAVNITFIPCFIPFTG